MVIYYVPIPHTREERWNAVKGDEYSERKEG